MAMFLPRFSLAKTCCLVRKMTTSSLIPRYFRELKELFYLSGPILGAQLASVGMNFVDTSMAGQYSAEDLAAIAIGSSIWMPIFILVRGILMAVTPTVAQLYGAGSLEKVATPVRQAMWIALGLSLLSILFLMNTAPLLTWLEVEPAVANKAQDYLTAIAWGVPAICFYQVLACYCEGRSYTKPAMLFSFMALLLNIPVNYVLIYGKLGFPELGGVGCGYATAACFWLMGILMYFYTKYDSRHQDIKLFSKLEKPDFSAIKEHLKLGVPMGLAIFFEASIFSAVALVIGKLGAVTVAGHQIALNASSIAFMIPLSMSMGITIRVGQALGAGQLEAARFSGLSGIAATLVTATMTASIMWFLPEQVARVYSNDPEVIVLAAELMLFSALFQYADGIQVAANGALRGFKDTRVPMIIVFIACWGIALPLGYTLALTDWLVEPMGPHGMWIGLVTALTLSAIFLTLRFWRLTGRYLRSESDSYQANTQAI